MRPPFLAKFEGREALITSKLSGLFGPGKWMGRWLDNPREMQEFDLNSIKPSVDPSDGIDGDIIRFLIADRWLDRGGREGMSMALRASIDFSAFQLRPLLKFFGEAQRRILIADETGLGKTIEAGMILTEILAAKGSDVCIVILCPKSVEWKWIWELKTKFGIRAARNNFKEFKESGVPSGVHVITHSASRTEDSLQVPDKSIDLLIIDEIHNFIGRTANQKRRGRAIDLSRASKGVIGLSATPVQIEENDLRKILDLIAPGEHNEQVWPMQSRSQIAVNRIMMAQRDGGAAEPTDVDIIRNDWPEIDTTPDDLLQPLSPEEWGEIELEIRSIGPIGRRMTRARGRDPDVNNYRERKVSTIVVPRGNYDDIIRQIDDFIRRNMHFVNRQQFASCPAAALEILNDTTHTDEVEQIISRIENEMVDDGPKQRALIQLLVKLGNRDDVTKTVVFTHWHPTFYHLKEMIKLNNITVFAVNPTLDGGEAAAVINRFEDCDGYAVLLVTDKMSEGIDLHMANTMVNMDLPYNPAKLQQRIGRLDRYIQKSKFIEIYNLILEGTHEEGQVEVLKERMDVFERMVGEYEAILSTDEDENDLESESEARERMAELRGEVDLHRLAASNVILRIMDSALDGQIGDKQREIHPIHARLHLIIQAALQRMGADTSWNEELGEIRVTMSDSLRRSLLNSKTFMPWGDGRVRAAFESVDNEGIITLKMRGRKTTMGPLDPFLISCENLLWEIEGMDSDTTEIEGAVIVGSKDNVDRWMWHEDGEMSITSGQNIISQITAGVLLLGNWNINESNITNRVKNK